MPTPATLGPFRLLDRLHVAQPTAVERFKAHRLTESDARAAAVVEPEHVIENHAHVPDEEQVLSMEYLRVRRVEIQGICDNETAKACRKGGEHFFHCGVPFLFLVVHATNSFRCLQRRNLESVCQ